ncbi:MAG: capsule biosynthesis protein CapA [Paracoccus sp. (in: a-proteobacteria)]|nr:capsule biosynthesis protein CapA [Paracoccus sp. (in: a-proteobacteria)]
MAASGPLPQSASGPDRVFLMLQGPHGPFFARLAVMLRAAGAKVWRCGFNIGDQVFWPDRNSYIPCRGKIEDWPAMLGAILDEKKVTDIVIYGDVRPIHAIARRIGVQRGLTVHVFEEGYLRPYWISYERGGSNGHSPLMQVGIDRMRRDLRDHVTDVRRPPARWGDMREHKFYGLIYHLLLFLANRGYRNFCSHRAIPVSTEVRLNAKRLILSPLYALQRSLQWRKLRLAGWPFTLVLMQLEHDSNFQGHSSFSRNAQFIDQVIDAFAVAAPRHHHLVFKAHPLEDGRAGNMAAIRAAARRTGIEDRVHYIRGGKLAEVMSHARAVVTVNSTGAQQALWRGIPVKALGDAVYDKPGLVSPQSLPDFLARPIPPDPGIYRIFRDYLLKTSQIPGGFYARRSRAHALRLVADMMLAEEDPYEALASGRVAYRQQPVDHDD